MNETLISLDSNKIVLAKNIVTFLLEKRQAILDWIWYSFLLYTEQKTISTGNLFLRKQNLCDV